MKETGTGFNNLQTLAAEGAVVVGVDVDTQVDFAQEGGALYVPTSSALKSNLRRLSQSLPYRIGSVDSHAYDAWEFAENGLMQKRFASINDLPIKESERKFRWERT